jgi:hypothetical protein
MSLERVGRLVEIGFQWAIKDPRYVPWETRYDELVAFIVSVRRDQICFRFPVSQLIIIIIIPCPSQKEHGHAQVPIGYEVR